MLIHYKTPGMAVARDGGSLFTEKRLEEIRKRMEVVEKETKV